MEQQPFVETRHEIDGLAVIDSGPPASGPPVVIIHGGMDRSSSFGRTVRRMAATPIRRYDRRGYGRSSGAGVADLDGHIADLLSVAGPEPVVAFGHSVGGTIALVAAHRHPERFAAVGIYEAPLPWLTGGVGAPAVDPAVGPEEAAEGFMIRMVGDRVWERLPPSTRDARRAEGPALLADLGIVDGTEHVPAGRFPVPLLIAAGSEGGRRRALAEEAAKALEVTAMIVAGADHGVHLRDPAATADLIGRVCLLAGA